MSKTIANLETEASIDVHLRRIKTKCGCLSAFAPGELSYDHIVRDEESLELLRQVDQLLTLAIDLMPIDGDWMYAGIRGTEDGKELATENAKAEGYRLGNHKDIYSPDSKQEG